MVEQERLRERLDFKMFLSKNLMNQNNASSIRVLRVRG